MFNLSSLFEDYEKRYNTWLKNSAVPNVKGWYDKSGLDTGFQNIQTGLLGRESRQMHPTEGVVTGDRYGGIFGQGGSASKALDYAGGKVLGARIGYGEGKVDPRLAAAAGRTKTSGFPTKISGEGAIKGRMPGALEKGLETGLEIGVDTVKKGVDLGNQALEWAFPNAEWAKTKSSISSNDKEKLGDMIKSGKIDHGFVNALKKKTSPLNENELSGVEKLIGMSKEDVAKQWKDKGGFEGLMSNPAFTLGLALMQSSAEGKTIGGDIMNNFISAAKLSEHYKDRIDARTQVLGPPTKEERKLAAGALESMGVSGPGFWKGKIWDNIKLWGKDNEADFDAGLNKIIIKSKEIIKKKYRGKTHQITEKDYIDAFNKLQDSKELGSVENIFGVGIEDMKKNKTKKKSWVQKQTEKLLGEDNIFLRRAEGGPIPAGQPAIVGEKGPEVIVPKADVNVISNDDSQVMGMLLASNPQLQNVSKARAESILRSRFPDYFA